MKPWWQNGKPVWVDGHPQSCDDCPCDMCDSTTRMFKIRNHPSSGTDSCFSKCLYAGLAPAGSTDEQKENYEGEYPISRATYTRSIIGGPYVDDIPLGYTAIQKADATYAVILQDVLQNSCGTKLWGGTYYLRNASCIDTLPGTFTNSNYTITHRYYWLITVNQWANEKRWYVVAYHSTKCDGSSNGTTTGYEAIFRHPVEAASYPLYVADTDNKVWEEILSGPWSSQAEAQSHYP